MSKIDLRKCSRRWDLRWWRPRTSSDFPASRGARCFGDGAEPQPKAGIDRARLERYLSEWGYWMTRGGGARGYGGYTPAFINSRTSSSFEDLCNDMGSSINRTMDAVIRGLPQHEQHAIWMHCGVMNVWRYARLDPVKVLEEAKRHVGEGLIRKGIPV